MKKLVLILALLGLSVAAPTNAHTTKASWTAFDAEQRLTVGRFAASHGIKYATCLGSGAAVNPKASAFTRRYRHLECQVQDKAFKVERQLVVHVRTPTTFTAEWLTTKECT
jgi:hypothetical protein